MAMMRIQNKTVRIETTKAKAIVLIKEERPGGTNTAIQLHLDRVETLGLATMLKESAPRPSS